jgi:hypothetical protein
MIFVSRCEVNGAKAKYGFPSFIDYREIPVQGNTTTALKLDRVIFFKDENNAAHFCGCITQGNSGKNDSQAFTVHKVKKKSGTTTTTIRTTINYSMK